MNPERLSFHDGVDPTRFVCGGLKDTVDRVQEKTQHIPIVFCCRADVLHPQDRGDSPERRLHAETLVRVEIQFSVFSFQSLELFSPLILVIRGSQSSHFLTGFDSRIDCRIPKIWRNAVV